LETPTLLLVLYIYTCTSKFQHTHVYQNRYPIPNGISVNRMHCCLQLFGSPTNGAISRGGLLRKGTCHHPTTVWSLGNHALSSGQVLLKVLKLVRRQPRAISDQGQTAAVNQTLHFIWHRARKARIIRKIQQGHLGQVSPFDRHKFNSARHDLVLERSIPSCESENCGDHLLVYNLLKVSVSLLFSSRSISSAILD
jgi:hypothetical protein